MINSPKYWVACSGGVDSVVLLHIMQEQGLAAGILHCNFHLRGKSSNEDEEFVRELAEKLGVPIKVKNFDTKQYSKENNINTQLAARELRYSWFDDIIQNENGIVLLAHHYDDQIETFFLQLRRGGKVKGLAGMPVFRNGYLRPMLKYSKFELIDLANKHNWKWREDITNASNDYTRNWYRNVVLPALTNSDFPLSDVVPLMHSFQNILSFLKRLEIPNKIAIEDWIAMPVWIKEHILTVQDLGEYNALEIDRLAKAEKGKFIGNDLVKLWNEGDELVFVKVNNSQIQFGINIIALPIDEVKMNSSDLFLDADKIKGNLFPRKWEAGDRFQPLGMKGEKTLGKFLRDHKVPVHLKENVQVLVNENSEVIGVFGFGVSENMKIDSKTNTVLCIQLNEK